MTDGLREQTAAAIREHREPEDYNGSPALCGCGLDLAPDDTPTWAEHVADAVIEALNLKEEKP